MLYIDCVFAPSTSTQLEVKLLHFLEARFFEVNEAAWCCVFWAIAPGSRSPPATAPWFPFTLPTQSERYPRTTAPAQKTVGIIFDVHIFTPLFYDSLQKLPTAISLLFAIY
ncbi:MULTISPECIES: hypothetical protein [unclassified Microcoleus]|uniref:hypothetical protein n=1 Tax=unclassified Microcoleus TaxID=2642155 RepID=UPI0025EEEB12|nr:MULTISPECIES: hypothetical protein [unclassified Microcoleus]